MVLSPSEQQHLLVELNQSAPLELSQTCIHGLFEAQAEKTPLKHRQKKRRIQ